MNLGELLKPVGGFIRDHGIAIFLVVFFIVGESTGLSANGRFSVNQKLDPFPSMLLTPIDPSISSTRLFEIARPKPVPPNSRLVEESA